MKMVRLGIIGMGNIGKHHAEYLLAGKVPRCELKAICSTSPQKLESYKSRGVKVFGDAQKLVGSGEIDAVVIATPHPQHPAQGIAALEAGLHVMVEKPISAHKADGERLISVASKHPKQVFAAMFQLRVEQRVVGVVHVGKAVDVAPAQLDVVAQVRRAAKERRCQVHAAAPGVLGGPVLP